MVSERLEVRLDSERRRRLHEIAATRGASISDIVRSMIDREYEAASRARRLRAATVIGRLQIEDVPDPDTLSSQLSEAHDPGPVR
jgi:hypothetical protein